MRETRARAMGGLPRKLRHFSRARARFKNRALLAFDERRVEKCRGDEGKERGEEGGKQREKVGCVSCCAR